MSEPTPNGPGRQALATVAALLFGLAAVIAWDITSMAPAQAVGVGPTAVMRIVVGLLLVLGLAHAIAAARAAPKAQAETEPATNRAALGWVLGGLIGMIAVLQLGAGFVLGATWLFAATARAFGQPLRSRSPVIGLVLAALVYAFFTQALSLSLPAGPLERLLLG
ncbi:tripartite tricarboxylate transporter TctB family protein [Acidovorax sp. CCYZU-2555]|uniref:tripartite tricarboxylate transporter TctB family protein n=1 Tax=Acidovorax sp. CCYZU-2555 TaxID=2835042 RepID=UPI001BCB0739|nr:tripartite tricarboxylate transporter TctB family protein [Acidovorax sp. CCYZU-2555]MBS7777980.1 tripartite tricarboxylate transporter TctB family protein [Acidovorax sp. CCYZU-2555]